MSNQRPQTSRQQLLQDIMLRRQQQQQQMQQQQIQQQQQQHMQQQSQPQYGMNPDFVGISGKEDKLGKFKRKVFLSPICDI